MINRILFLVCLSVAGLFGLSTAGAQQITANVVANCGTPNGTPVAGGQYPLTVDTSGRSCSTGAISGTVSTNITQFGGSNVVTGTGVGGAGIPRVTVSSDSTLSDNATIVGPLGAATAPASAVSTVFPDEVNACTGGNTCTVTSAATLATIDMTGYASVSVTVTANASGNTITFTETDDSGGATNLTFAFGCYTSSASCPGIFSTATTNVPSTFVFSKKKRYLKIAVTTFVSGTTTVTAQLHQNAPVIEPIAPVLSASTAAIGKVGFGFTSAQTPITASATGTTAATTATLAGTSGKTTYLCGFSIRANATAAATGNATVTGTITGTMNFTQWTAPLATGIGITEPNIGNICIPASGTNTGIAVVSAAPGTGGVVSVSAWGYQE